MIDLTPSEKRKLVCSMYLQGFSYRDIMKATGYYTTSAIARIIASKGLANREINYTASQLDEMIELWRDKLTPAQIGLRMGLSKDQVEGKLRRLDLID